MAAVANATGLTPASEGLLFPPCGVDDLASLLRPRDEGGHLEHAGQVEVISSVERDGRPVFRDLRWGIYVTFRAAAAAERGYIERCFKEYGIVTDPSGRYAAMYKPSHLIGLELGISVASVGLRREATGGSTNRRSQCVCGERWKPGSPARTERFEGLEAAWILVLRHGMSARQAPCGSWHCMPAKR